MYTSSNKFFYIHLLIKVNNIKKTFEWSRCVAYVFLYIPPTIPFSYDNIGYDNQFHGWYLAYILSKESPKIYN